jgi:uncharacterized membrane protein
MHIDPLIVFFRWLHVVTACVVVGCAFIMAVLLPAGMRDLEPEQREAALVRSRRALKMVVHTGILLFLISGIYNYLGNRGAYKQWPQVAHSLFGIHVLGAVIACAILIVVLAGRQTIRGFGTWTKINLVVLAITIAAASTLKSAREAVIKKGAQTPTQVGGER